MSKINEKLREAGILTSNNGIESKLREAPFETLIPFKIPEGKTAHTYRASIRQEYVKHLENDFILSTKIIGNTVYALKEAKAQK